MANDPRKYGLVYSPHDPFDKYSEWFESLEQDEHSEWFESLEQALLEAGKSARCGHVFYLVQRLDYDAEGVRKSYLAEVCKCGHSRDRHNYNCFECACDGFEEPSQPSLKTVDHAH